MSDVNELLSVSLINKVMAKGNTIFIFTSGVLRGKLISATTTSTVPSPTYLKGASQHWTKLKPETCAVLRFAPGPKDPGKVKDPLTFSFTRKPQTFRLPERVLNSKGFHLTRIDGSAWMLNIVSSFKGETEETSG